MTQPDQLKSAEPLQWSPGRGIDVWAMISAAIAGDLDAIRELVERDPSLVRSHYGYRKPLYFAVRENSVAVARFLLERDPDPFGLAVNDSLLEIARDRGYMELEALIDDASRRLCGATPEGNPVCDALRERDLERAGALVDESPALLHTGDRTSNQPIHWAVMTRNIDAIDAMLARGADINARRKDGARPIHLSNGDYNYRGWRDVPKDVDTTPAEVLDHLIAKGAYVDIWTASHRGDVERLRQLLDEEPSLANRNSDYRSYYLGSGSALRNAAAKGHIALVRLLLDRGADPNLPEEHIAPHGHALYSAVYSGHHDIARLLLAHGAIPNVEVESSADTLSIAISNNDAEMVELLCSHGAARRLHLLAYYGDVQTAAAMLAAKSELADDVEALSNAAGCGRESFVRLMLRYRPRLAERLSMNGGKTPEMARLLQAHGWDPNRADWLGITPLHECARRGNVERAALLLDLGANLEARDEDICSRPLAWAAKFGQLAMVEFLLTRGAQLEAVDDPPWATPLEWALRRGHSEVAGILGK